jgi:hypothetical protein
MEKKKGMLARGRERSQLKSAHAPQPKWDTPEWLEWKLRQMKKAFDGSDAEAYTQAWDEFKTLLNGLLTASDFWHVSHAVALLPTLLAARQEIDLMNRHEKRMRAGMKAAETRKVRSAAS